MQAKLAASSIVLLGLGCAGGSVPARGTSAPTVDAAPMPVPTDGPAAAEPAITPPDAAAGGSVPAPDAGGAGPADAAPPPASAPGQGPLAEGKIVFSQDFETGMDGITRSPTDLPAERAQIAADP